MTEKLDLEAIRREIDEADSNLINAFERRLQAVLRVAEYKKQNNLPVRDRARELKVIEKAQGKLRNKNYAPAVAGLMEQQKLRSGSSRIDGRNYGHCPQNRRTAYKC